MVRFIRCPSCGFYFAPFIQFFEKAKEALYKKEVFDNPELKDYDPRKLAFNPGTTPSLKKIFDALGIKLMCCRMRIESHVKTELVYQPSAPIKS